jgi:hypothetical protein
LTQDSVLLYAVSLAYFNTTIRPWFFLPSKGSAVIPKKDVSRPSTALYDMVAQNMTLCC